MGLTRNSSIRVHGGGPRSGGKKEMEMTNTAKRPAQERSANFTFGEDDVKDASALNSTFGDDDTKDSSALNSTFGEHSAKDASALNSTWSTSTLAMEAIEDIEEDGYSQKSESSLQVLYRAITKDSSALNSTFGEYSAKDASALNSTWSTSTLAMEAIEDIEEDGYSQKSESSLQVLYRSITSGLFGHPVDTANRKHCLPPKEGVIGASMNDISQVTDASCLSELTLPFAPDKANVTGATAVCCGLFS